MKKWDKFLVGINYMKVTIQQTTKIILELTENEASWLKDIMQNPLQGEAGIDKGYRETLFNELNSSKFVN